VKRHLKAGLLAAVSGMTRRTAVLLAAQADAREPLLAVRAPYRVEGPTLVLHVDEPGRGTLTASFVPGSDADTWSSAPLRYDGPVTLTLDLRNGQAQLGDVVMGSVSQGLPVADRRFSWRLTLAGDSIPRSRCTGHYVVRTNQAVDAAYYGGEDYVDYEAESEAVHEEIVALARAHGARGPALEVGCATGGTLQALRSAGIDAYGIDFSEWAVDRARERVGPDHVWRCDVEREPLPDGAVARAPFSLLVLASVFEHFARPFDVLERLTSLVRPGAILLLITSNADSLTHRIFGRDWEGYFDWTHHGVDAVTAQSIRRGLPVVGWQVLDLRTWHLWDGCEDPTHATLRDWHAADARFRALLAERELGDFITCVAVRA